MATTWKGGLLVGGGSRRMGRDKGLLEVGGLALATRAATALGAVADEVVLLGSGPVPPELGGLRRLPDAPGTAGPLAALRAALRAEPAATWIVCPCDLPRLDAAALRWLAAQRGPGIVAVLPRLPAADGTPGGGPPQPLPALYEPAAGPLLEALAATGGRGPSHLAGSPGVASPAVPLHLAAAWRDVDTPEELAAARRRSAPAPSGGEGSEEA